MGVTILNALALVESWRSGARFDATLTLGRLECHMNLHELRRIARLLPVETEFARIVARGEVPAYMDDFFKAMGAKTVDALDASDFDGATIVHDLNELLPPQLHARFDAVVDGGTIEHVFNVPAALKAVMDALKVGGTFSAILPANNWCGHGFYQFGAGLFYSVFGPDNGFRIERLLVAPAYVGGRWVDGPAFEVSDPEAMRDRVEIESTRKTVFIVDARKISQRQVFATWPQETGYAEAWARPAAVPSQPQPPQSARSRAGAAWSQFQRLTRVGGLKRAIERAREKRLWLRQCRSNPALASHRWMEDR